MTTITRDVIPRYDYGASDIICVISPTERATELQQHVELLEETILTNVLGNFSTVDIRDPDLEKELVKFQKVLLCGSVVAKHYMRFKRFSDVNLTEHLSESGRQYFVVPAPKSMGSKKVEAFIKDKINAPV